MSGTHPVELALVDDGPQVDALVQPTAGLQLSVHGSSEASHKLIVDRLVHEDPVGCHASLWKGCRTSPLRLSVTLGKYIFVVVCFQDIFNELPAQCCGTLRPSDPRQHV